MPLPIVADLVQFGLTAFVTLLVVVDPFGIVPIFTAMTRGQQPEERVATLTQAVTTAFGVAIFFLLAGHAVLSYLGVTVDAFAISGGILLFATALPMLLGQRPGLQGPEPAEHAAASENIAVFPLAIPLLTGPGTIATILLLTSGANGDLWHFLVLAVAIGIVDVIAYAAMRGGDRIINRLGEGQVHIITRVLGILLAALAVQYVMNGIAGYMRSLAVP